MSKVWFITGASGGFGSAFARAALARRDRVVGTARNLRKLDGLVADYGDAFFPLALDITDREQVGSAVTQAHERFGRMDVVVNSVGCGRFGAVEELSEADLREQFETNFFGVVWVTQAVLPILRAQGSGHIVEMSSLGGLTSAPLFGAYMASKWALEGLGEALAQEVAGLGIKVTLVEPGEFATDWYEHSTRKASQQPQYEPVREAMRPFIESLQSGDPNAAAQVLLEIVDSDDPPLRILFGTYAADFVPAVYARRLEEWKVWEAQSRAATGEAVMRPERLR
jgi:NAD(P)-dependent dehydrogenase (short-subunit alcohol dehydrogenase family)